MYQFCFVMCLYSRYYIVMYGCCFFLFSDYTQSLFTTWSSDTFTWRMALFRTRNMLLPYYDVDTIATNGYAGNYPFYE